MAPNISFDGVEQVLINGEYIAVPDIRPPDYNQTFFEQAGVFDALIDTHEPHGQLCMPWLNFGILGGVIFTLGLLGGVVFQVLFSRVERARHNRNTIGDASLTITEGNYIEKA